MSVTCDLSKLPLDALDDLEERIIDKLHVLSLLPAAERAQHAARQAALEDLRRVIQAQQRARLADATQSATAAMPWRPIGRLLSS